MTSPSPKIIPIFPKPLVCIEGEDRPPLVPYYAGENCDLEKAKEGIKLVLDSYTETCEKSAWKAKTPIIGRFFRSLSLPKESPYRLKEESCENLTSKKKYEQTIPFILKNFDLLDPPHPFFNIVYRLNAHQLEDFRSAEIFLYTADSLAEEFSKNSIRSLEATYPGSGSHVAPLVIALRMIDLKKIDSASFIYTEMDESSVRRIEKYLEGSSEIFKNLQVSQALDKSCGEGYEVTFTWEYKSKPITLTVAINRGGDYSRDEYLTKANLTILHDRGRNPLDDRAFMERIIYLREDAKIQTPAWALTEQLDLFTRKAIPGYQYQYFPGYYGCTARSRVPEEEKVNIYTLKDGKLITARKDQSVFQIHLDQQAEGAFLYYLPTYW